MNTFPTVLVMESTYKINLYRMPLFDIVAVTSTGMTYSIAFSFLFFEKEGNFTWVLKMLVGSRDVWEESYRLRTQIQRQIFVL